MATPKAGEVVGRLPYLEGALNMARYLVLCMALFVFAATDVNAQDDRKGPPDDALKLSEIIAKVEARPDFKYVGEVDWDDDGYSVTYYTADRAKVEITYNAVTGEPK